MEEIAEQIVADIQPRSGWKELSTEKSLVDATLTLLLEGIDEEIAEEVIHRIVETLRSEYGR